MPNPVIPKIPEGAMFLTAARDNLNLLIDAMTIGGAPDPDLVPLLQHLNTLDADYNANKVSVKADIDGLWNQDRFLNTELDALKLEYAELLAAKDHAETQIAALNLTVEFLTQANASLTARVDKLENPGP